MGRVVYLIVERLTMAVVVITIVGITFAVFQQPVLNVAGEFFGVLLTPGYHRPANWDPADLSTVLTAIVFAGAGGFGQLFLSYWMRDKGVGMSAYIGRITSPLRTAPEAISATGYAFEDNEANRTNYRKFMRYLHIESGLGVALNLITTIIMCWLAWALLMPQGIVPEGWEIAVVQSAFFEVSWGAIGKIIFLVIAAALPLRRLAAVHRRLRPHAGRLHLRQREAGAAVSLPDAVLWIRRGIHHSDDDHAAPRAAWGPAHHTGRHRLHGHGAVLSGPDLPQLRARPPGLPLVGSNPIPSPGSSWSPSPRPTSVSACGTSSSG